MVIYNNVKIDTDNVRLKKLTRKAAFRKNVLWHILIMILSLAVMVSFIFCRGLFHISGAIDNIDKYDNTMIFTLSDYEKIVPAGTEDYRERQKAEFDKIINELFVNNHSEEDCAYVRTCDVKLSARLRTQGYRLYSICGYDLELSKGRWYEEDRNEAVVYGGSLKVGDVFMAGGEEYTVVGILKCQLPAHTIYQEYPFWETLEFGKWMVLQEYRQICLNPQSTVAKDYADVDYSIVFDKDKYDVLEMDNIEKYGDVTSFDEYVPVSSGFLRVLMFTVPVFMSVLYVAVLYFGLRRMRYNLTPEIALYTSHGASEKEGKKFIRNSVIMDFIPHIIFALAVLQSGDVLGTPKNLACLYMIFAAMTVGVMIVFDKKRFYKGFQELDKMYGRLMLVIPEMTVAENLMLMYAIKADKTEYTSIELSKEMARCCYLEDVLGQTVSSLDARYKNRLKLVLGLMMSDKQTLCTDDIRENASAQEQEITDEIVERYQRAYGTLDLTGEKR